MPANVCYQSHSFQNNLPCAAPPTAPSLVPMLPTLRHVSSGAPSQDPVRSSFSAQDIAARLSKSPRTSTPSAGALFSKPLNTTRSLYSLKAPVGTSRNSIQCLSILAPRSCRKSRTLYPTLTTLLCIGYGSYEPFAALWISQYIGNNTKSCKAFLDTLDTRILIRTMISLAILRNPSADRSDWSCMLFFRYALLISARVAVEGTSSQE